MKIKSFFRKFWFRWLEARRPRIRSVLLTQKNTYIFPTRYGWLLLVIVLLMGIGATNYQNNLIFIATFTVVAMGVLSIMLTYANLVGLKFTVHPADAVYAGQRAQFPISVTGHKAHAAIVIGELSMAAQTVDLVADEEKRVSIRQECPLRGRQEIAPIRCQSLYPFGFLQAWSWLFFEAHCIVYPAPVQPPFEHPDGEGNEPDDTGQFKPGVEDFYGLKPYQPGDTMSRIHWKSFARGKGLQTKQFVDYISDPDLFDYNYFTGIDQETRLSFLSYLVTQAEAAGQQFGIVLPGTRITAGSGEKHLHQCLTALALFNLDRQGKAK